MFCSKKLSFGELIHAVITAPPRTLSLECLASWKLEHIGHTPLYIRELSPCLLMDHDYANGLSAAAISQ